MITDTKKFAATFSRIAHNKSEDIVFGDFLDMVICALSLGKYEAEYLSIVKKYEAKEVDLFCELLAEMIIIMDNDGSGFTDCLGEFFTTFISRGRNGQFFTPHNVCDMMAAMTINSEDLGKKILDPCCGSGRMLLSAAKTSRNNYFFGADIDARCVKMTAINMCLNSLSGEVAHMNSLSNEHWGGYTISRTRAYPRIPIITKLNPNEGIIYNSAPFHQTAKIVTASQGKLNFE